MEQIIELAPDDDLTSIRARLEWTQARRVLIVVPRKNKTLRSLVNQKVLVRIAKKQNVDLAISSRDMKTRDTARQAGIKTFAGVWFAKRFGYISDVAENAAPEQTQAPQVRTTSTEPPRKVRIQNKKLVVVTDRGRGGCLSQLIALLLAVVLAFGVVVLLLALVPRATVTLIPQVSTVSTQITLTADPDPEVDQVDAENGIIPARPVQVELSTFAEVETIETERAPVDLAAGQIVIFNRTLDEQTVPVSTTVRTSSGVAIEFITLEEVIVPAGNGATAIVPIQAIEEGPVGNVPAGQINRFTDSRLSLLMRVINDQPTSGGSLRIAGVVTDADKDRVRSKLRQVVQQQGYEQMLAELDNQEYIPPESLQVIEMELTYDKFSGDVSETLGAEMRAVVRATAVGNFYANQLAYYDLLDQVPPGATLLPEGMTFTAGGIEAVDDRSITFNVQAQGYVVAEIDPDEVREGITFMAIGEAQEWISNNFPIITVPGIDVTPNWLGRVPPFPFQIDVVIRDVTELTAGKTE